MVRRRLGKPRRRLAVLVPACVLGLAAPAAGTPSPGPTAAEADTSVGHVPPDLEEAVAELERADQPLPERELAAAGSASSRRGYISWRSAVASGGWRQDLRLSHGSGPFQGRVALRLRPGLPARASGAGGLGGPALRVWAGHLVLRHGLGLATDDPARRASPAADGALGRVTGGLVPLTTTAAGPLRLGFSAARGQWRLEGVAAARPDSGRPRDWTARIAHGDRGTSWSFLATRDSLGARLGAAGRLARPTLTVDWEVATSPGRSGGAPPAIVTGLAWQPAPRLRLEFMSGAAHGSPAARPAVLPGGADRGWAGRFQWRERGVGALALLLQGAGSAERAAGAERRRLAVQEASWERQAAGGFRAFLRCRRVSRRSWEWSERAPWLPAVAAPASARTLVAAGVEREADGGLLAVHWRSFTAGDAAGQGTRQSFTLAARRPGRGGREWRVEATTAWGDPVDLVQAVSPLPGLVVPRHWGRWRSELVVGGSFAWGPLQVRAALARRLPEPASAAAGPLEGATLEGWFEARGAW